MRNFVSKVHNAVTVFSPDFGGNSYDKFVARRIVDELVKLLEVEQQRPHLMSIFDPCMMDKVHPEAGWTSYFTPGESRTIGEVLVFVQAASRIGNAHRVNPVFAVNMNTGRNVLFIQAVPYEGCALGHSQSL